jgi:hypothetical protein
VDLVIISTAPLSVCFVANTISRVTTNPGVATIGHYVTSKCHSTLPTSANYDDSCTFEFDIDNLKCITDRETDLSFIRS